MWIINACSTSISSYPCRSLSDEKYSPGNTNHIKRKKSPSTLLIICFSSFFGGHMKPCCPLIGWSLSSRLLEHAPQRLVTYFDVCVCVYICVSLCDCVCCGPASTVTCFWPGELIPPIIIQLLDMTESHSVWPQHIPHSQGQQGQRSVSRDGLLCR